MSVLTVRNGSACAMYLAGLCVGLLALLAFPAPRAADKEDPYRWLEELTGKKALDWVKTQNAETETALTRTSGFKLRNERMLKILNSTERLPEVSKVGEMYYNFWRDTKNQCGVWRRTTQQELKKPEPKWETVLDL